MAPVAMLSLIVAELVMVAISPTAAWFDDATGEGELQQQKGCQSLDHLVLHRRL
jgi:hypothetical protein